MTHEELRDSLPAFALGALDPDERRLVAAHLATCDECATELASLGRVVDGIGLEATPVTPPAALKTKVLERIASESRVSGQPRTRMVAMPLKAKSPLWLRGLPLAASVVLAVGATLYAIGLRSELVTLRQDVAATTAEASRLRGELATLRRNWVEVTRAMNVLKAPDMLRVDLKGQADAPAASGRAFWSRTAGLIFTADRLPALSAGRVYQLWTITGGAATGAGVFVPDATGAASVTAVVAADAPQPDAFGVTIEPAGGSTTPTMPIVLVGASK